MGGEVDALLLDLAQGGQGEDLEAAGVGEHGAVPGHEFVQTAALLHQLVAGTQVQVIGVGKLHLTADVLQVLGAQRALDGTLGAHIHKYGGLDRAVGAGEFAPTGLALGLFQFKHGSTSKAEECYCEPVRTLAWQSPKF